MSELVRRLCEGEHPVEVRLRPEKSMAAFQDSIDRGYIHIKFTNTQGGTELGVPLDRKLSELSGANFTAQTGRVKIVGPLTLDYIKVRCIAEIDLPSLAGKGHLEIDP